MSGEPVFDFDGDRVGWPGAIVSGIIVDRDIDVVDLLERAGDRFAVVLNGDFAFDTGAKAGPDEAALELIGGRELGADMGEVSGVARLAVGFEVGFTSFGISGDDVQPFVESAVGDQFDLQVQVLGDVVELFLREVWEGGHAAVDGALRDQRADLVALFIMKDESGADEVGAFGSAGFFAVAEAAVGLVETLATGGGGLVGCGAEAEKLTGVEASTGASGGVVLRLQECCADGEAGDDWAKHGPEVLSSRRYLNHCIGSVEFMHGRSGAAWFGTCWDPFRCYPVVYCPKALI